MPNSERNWSVDEKLVQELRSRFLAETDEEDPDLYHPDDIVRVKENDWYIARYLLQHHENVDNALKMLKESLKWRKEYEVNTISRADIPTEFLMMRAVFVYSKDKYGHPIVMVRSKAHVKDDKIKRLQKMFIIYWTELALRSSDWGSITMIFDCTDSGISNMELDIIQFIMNMFKKYYPWSLNYFVVYNFPRYLAGLWKIIKRLVPEQYTSKLKLVDKVTIRDLVNPDQLPIALGGTCTKLYEPKEGVEEVLSEEEDMQFPEAAEC